MTARLVRLLSEPRCGVCRARAHWGFGVDLKKGEPGRWYCADHKARGDRPEPKLPAPKAPRRDLFDGGGR